MRQWFYLRERLWRFKFGTDDYPQARGAAEACSGFLPDDEDEHTDDTLRSCYNCMYRRWLDSGFDCHRKL